jgi:predicted nuclease with RNAse H fold
VITAGVDLAAQPERTAVAIIEWSDGRAVIEDVTLGVDDEAILRAVRRADKAGIDCPFGWPTAFVGFVTSHHGRHVSDPVPRRNLTMRRTDIFVHERLGLTPLSVSADRIAHVAFRCAVLLGRIEAAVGAVDRSGTGLVAEVYPAASLRSWGLIHHGYKGKTNPAVLGDLVDRLLDEAPWLDCAADQGAMRGSHDVFDAVIAAMTARAAALGQILLPARDDLADAATEGWIAIPDKPISALRGA